MAWYIQCNAEGCEYISEEYNDIGKLIIKIESEGGSVSLVNNQWKFQCPDGHDDQFVELKET